MTKQFKKMGCLFMILLGGIGVAFFLWGTTGDMERRTVKVGFFEYPPYNMTDPQTGQPTGYCVDILDAVAKSQNLDIEYVKTLFTNYKEDIPKGEPYSMGLPIIITPERQRIYNFSWPCDENDTVLVVKKGSALKKVSELKTCVIGTVKGVEKAYCRKMSEDGKVKAHKTYHSTAKLHKALETGEVDAIVIDRSIALYFQSRFPDVFDVTDLVFFSQYEGFPVRKNQEWLLKRVNDGLRDIMNSNEYSRIHRKYFPTESDSTCD